LVKRSCPGPLNPLLHDRHLHTPQDPYYAVAEKVARFLDCTCSILTLQGESDIGRHLKLPKSGHDYQIQLHIDIAL